MGNRKKARIYQRQQGILAPFRYMSKGELIGYSRITPAADQPIAEPRTISYQTLFDPVNVRLLIVHHPKS